MGKIKNKSIEEQNEQEELRKAEEQSGIKFPFAFRSEVSGEIFVF